MRTGQVLAHCRDSPCPARMRAAASKRADWCSRCLAAVPSATAVAIERCRCGSASNPARAATIQEHSNSRCRWFAADVAPKLGIPHDYRSSRRCYFAVHDSEQRHPLPQVVPTDWNRTIHPGTCDCGPDRDRRQIPDCSLQVRAALKRCRCHWPWLAADAARSQGSRDGCRFWRPRCPYFHCPFPDWNRLRSPEPHDCGRDRRRHQPGDCPSSPVHAERKRCRCHSPPLAADAAQNPESRDDCRSWHRLHRAVHDSFLDWNQPVVSKPHEHRCGQDSFWDRGLLLPLPISPALGMELDAPAAFAARLPGAALRATERQRLRRRALRARWFWMDRQAGQP